MRLGRSYFLRSVPLALALGLAACSAPDVAEPDEEVGSVGLAVTDPELRASSWARLWSDLPEDRGDAHFRACQAQPFRFTLAFRNMGSAIWRDVPGRGETVGSDVFLVTASGKKDRLTGKKRFSLMWDSNDWVRGDRKAKECTTKRGCRRTRFIHNGMKAIAPSQPGIYRSRWRMRDYSEAWGSTSQGFGPKVEVRVRVEECREPNECACKVTCSDGSSNVLWLVDGSDIDCQSSAQLNCLPHAATSHQYFPCPTPPVGGVGGSGGGGGTSAGTDPDEVNAEEPPDGPGFWITDADEGSGGSSGSSGSGGSGGSGASSSGGTGGGWWDDGEDDPGIGTDDVPDDPDFEEDGFDGVEEEFSSGVIPVQEEGCSVSAHRRPGGGLALACLVALGAALARRRGQKTS